jgi:hypothetical protein
MRARKLAAAAGVALLAGAVLPAAAQAHGLVGRTDLPIPTWLFSWAAAIVLVASFAALAVLWPRPQLQEPHERPLFRMPVVVDVVCALLGVALYVAVVYAGFAGTTTPTANLAPNVIYVHFWVGMVIVSVLFGDVFRAFNPWLAVAHAGAWVVRRLRPEARRLRSYPEWLGNWPAVAGILGFAWLELAYTKKSDPNLLAWLALGYATVQLAGMGVFGAEKWSRRADPFGVYFALFSRLSVFVRPDRRLHLRRFLTGAPALPVLPGTVALLTVAIGTTTFDGFSNGSTWASISPDMSNFFSDLGAGAATAHQWAATVGLIGCVLAVSGFFWLGVRGMQTVGEGHTARELAGRFAHTLIPIAFAYAVAHYFSLLVFQGQAAAYLISNPLGDGSNIFGTANTRIDYNLISTNGIWYVQVGALVCGHVTGLVLAHDRALAIYRRVREATRSQYWMLVVMVGFTSLGLWLLSAVNT